MKTNRCQRRSTDVRGRDESVAYEMVKWSLLAGLRHSLQLTLQADVADQA